jgi:hypothetical protein
MTPPKLSERNLLDSSPGTGKAISPVPTMDLGVAFTLFRRAALDEEFFVDDPFQPLSDRYAEATLTEEGFCRGMAILNIHYGYPDTPNPAMRRVVAFVQLLRSKVEAGDQEWEHFRRVYDRFNPILHALAWCPLTADEPFEATLFIRIASASPLSMEDPNVHPICN